MIDFISIILIAFGLSMDSFAVSISSGLILPEIRFKKAIIIAFSLAFFQGLMPLIGWLLGFGFQEYVKPVDHWVAFVLLAFLGLKMIWESTKKEEERENVNPLEAKVLLTMSVATSIDALIVGMSLAFVQKSETSVWRNILVPVIIIGIVTFIVSMLGILFGKKMGNRLGKRMEMIGGLVLLFIGIRILAEHLWF